MIRSLLRALPAAALLWCSLPAQAQDSAALAAVNKLADGGFEAAAPSYWTPSGAGATWSTAQAHSGTHSLALSGAGAASWTQGEVIRNWVDRFPATNALTLGAWVRTEGVNTNPGGTSEKFQLVYTFRDAAGNDILGQPVIVDLPQSAASSGWVNVSTASQGEIILPVDARSVTAVVRKGASATGTVYVDDFYVSGGGGWHGANVDLPGDWYTYWPGFDGGRETPNWVVAKTTAEAHTGSASLRVERLGPVLPGEEAVAITQRVPVTPGRPVLVSYWVKHDGNADPTTIGQGDNNLGITGLWYRQLQSGPAGYGEIGGADIRLNGEYNQQVIPLLPRNASNGWTNYAFVLYPLTSADPAGVSAAMEVRLRYWNTFTGVSYWDDIAVTNIAGSNLFGVAGEAAPAPGTPAAAAERWMTANAPNPFSGQTEIRFTLPAAEAVTLEVYDLLGRRVALLADDAPMAAASHTVAFERGDLPSGTYLVVLRTPSHSEARQVTVVR